MSVFRIKDSKYYQFDFKIRRYRFFGSTKCTDEHAAAAVEAKKRAIAEKTVADLDASDGEPLRIGAACDRWWKEVGQHGNDPDLEARLKWLAATLGPQTFVHDITNDDVSRLVEKRRLDRRPSGRLEDGTQLFRPISARTVNKTTVSLLRRVMRRARDNWDAAIIHEPKWKKHWLKETKFPVREISALEETRLDEAESAEFIALRRFMTITGLRRRNALLTWSQVDFEQAVVRVIAKGGEPRVVPLTKEAYAILWAQRGHHPEFVFTFIAQRTRLCPKTRDPKTGERFKFIKGQRYPITYYGMGSNKRKWAKAGVKARIHDIRHTTGMRTLRATGNLRVVQGILGHSDIAITAKFYTDALVDDMRTAMETTAAAKPAPAPALKATGEKDE